MLEPRKKEGGGGERGQGTLFGPILSFFFFFFCWAIFTLVLSLGPTFTFCPARLGSCFRHPFLPLPLLSLFSLSPLSLVLPLAPFSTPKDNQLARVSYSSPFFFSPPASRLPPSAFRFPPFTAPLYGYPESYRPLRSLPIPPFRATGSLYL